MTIKLRNQDKVIKLIQTGRFVTQSAEGGGSSEWGAITGNINTQTDLQAQFDTKVDKVTGKALSTNDYTTAEKNKLAGVATGATANDTDANLKNRANHTGSQAISTVTGLQTALDGKVDDGDLSAHTANTSNPHAVTKAQVGLSAVDNTSDLNKPVSTATQTALNAKANSSDLTTHTSNVSNPHSVTKAQVGLANVDNTSDANKPVSTAVQTALDGKANTSHNHDDRYYTETEVDTALAGKADTGDIPANIVESIVAGTNVTIDYTDPANPIINASGGGGGGAVDSVNGETGVVVLDQDDIGDGTTYKQYSQTEKTKLAGIADGATANSSDATLLDRANHTGVQAQSTITDLVTDLADKASASDLSTHIADTANPHGVTKAQVGLSNVDNTADVDKPVSTIVAAELGLKADDNAVVKLTGDQTVAGVKTFSSFPVLPSSDPTTDYQPATKKYVDDNAGGGGGGSVDLQKLRYHNYVFSASDDQMIQSLNGTVTQDNGTHLSITADSGSYIRYTTKLSAVDHISMWDSTLVANYLSRKWPTYSAKFMLSFGTGDAGTVVFTNKGIGWRNDTGASTVLARNANGTAETTTDVSASIPANSFTVRALQIVHTPTTNDKFYSNGSLLATHTTNVPSGNGYAQTSWWGMQLGGSGSVAASMTAGEMDMWQQLP